MANPEKVILKIVSVKGTCVAGHFVGQEFDLSKDFLLGLSGDPRAICPSAFHALFPSWRVLIDKGIYVGMFDEGLESPGEALLRGKFYMYEVFGGSDSWVPYHYKVYHVVGDPSHHIWKDTPRNINVSYTDTIGVGSSQVQVNVTAVGSGLPVAVALVCISGENVYVVEKTLLNGTAILNVNTTAIGQLNITLSGGNVIPFEGTVQVIEAITTFQLSVSVENGWNMVSIPGLHPTDQNVNT